jgi:hypothetical protein
MPIIIGRQVMKAGITHRSNGATNFHGHKNNCGSWFNIGSPGQRVTNQNPVHELAGIKVSGNNLSENGFAIPVARMVDKSTKPADFELNPADRRQHLSDSRKAASAMIAKIPFVLAQHIARAWKPHDFQD